MVPVLCVGFRQFFLYSVLSNILLDGVIFFLCQSIPQFQVLGVMVRSVIYVLVFIGDVSVHGTWFCLASSVCK